jgi:hypothetical protein
VEPALAGGRPPVEHRLLGLDRRTFKLPLIAVAIFALWAVISPALDRAIDYDDPVRAGDALILGPSTTIVPPVGWGIQSGVRTSEPTRAPTGSSARLALTGDGISLSTQTGPFSGDARAFVKQVALIDEKLGTASGLTVKGDLHTFTVDGRRGIAQEFTTLTGEGAIFGFVDKGHAIALVLAGTDDALSRQTTKLGEMIASIDFDAKVG